MPIDAIKLDQSFVRSVNERPVSQSLVHAIVAVAKALHLRVIAEGVETELEEQFLLENGVDERQGYYYGKPMPADQLEHWLAQRPAKP